MANPPAPLGPFVLAVVDPAAAEAVWCLEQYYAELDGRLDAGFDLGASRPVGLDETRPPRGLFVLARLDGAVVGCGALKFHRDDPGGPWAEVKRMWVSAAVRGRGLGRRLLADLEARAADAGLPVVRLDTNDVLVEAIALYGAAGYSQVAAYNDEAYADRWFEKRVSSQPS